MGSIVLGTAKSENTDITASSSAGTDVFRASLRRTLAIEARGLAALSETLEGALGDALEKAPA